MTTHHSGHTKTDSYRKIAISFFGVSLFLLGLVGYLFFSWATITVTPKALAVSEGFMFDVVELQQGSDLEMDQIPGKLVDQELEGTGTFSTKEGAPLVQRVTGMITVVNRSSKAQQLRETTRFLSSDGILFRSLAFVTVPSGGQTEVLVRADREGDLGSFDSTRFTLPGLWPGLQNQIYGNAFIQKTEGAGILKIVTQGDIESGIQEVVEKLKEKLKTLLEADGSTVQQIDARLTSAQTSAKAGDSADQFDVRVKAKVTAVIYSESNLRDAVTKKFLGKIGPGYDLLPPRDSDITASIEHVDAINKRASLKVVASAGRILSQDGLSIDKTSLAGKSSQEITSSFLASQDIENVSVKFYPFWVTRAPYLVDHINILVKKE